MSQRIFVPIDSSALSLGAERVARAIIAEAQHRGIDVSVVRNGSRGMFWLEPLVEVETQHGRIAYGPVQPTDVAELFEQGFLQGNPHRLGHGLTEHIPFLAGQERLTFARVGVTAPLSLEDYAAHGGWATLGPSALPQLANEVPPRAMTLADLATVRDAFVAAARRADAMGIEAIEIHAAHGYLLHQFLSPLANQRTDAYGGTLENRMRFALELFAAVRQVFSGALGLRLSATDWVEGGWDLAQSIVFAQALQKLGCNFVHVSSGGLSSAQKIALAPGYQLGFAKAIRAATGLPTTGVGLITEATQAEALLVAGDADLVALARAFLYDPRWPWHAASELGGTVQAHPAYWRALPRSAHGVFGNTTIGGR